MDHDEELFFDFECVEDYCKNAGLSFIEEAECYLRSGYPCPTDLSLKLASLGYDVPKLEAQYKNHF